MLRSRFALPILALVLLPLAGCQSAGRMISERIGSGSETLSLRMEDLNPSLSQFQSNEDYNFLGESVEYRQIGVAHYDEMFLRAAYIKGTVQQLSAMVDRFQAGQLSLETEQDYLFLRSMASFGLTALPSMITEGQTLLTQIATLRPTDVPPQKIPAALAALDQMRSNLTGMDPSALTGLMDTVTSVQCQIAEVGEAVETGEGSAFSRC